MDKFLLSIFTALLCLLPFKGTAQAATGPSSSPYLWTLASGDIKSFNTAITKSGVSWTVTKTGDGTIGSMDSNNGRGLQFGSSKKPVTSLTFSSTGFEGLKINKVEVNTSGASDTDATVAVKVDNTSLYCNNSTSATLTTTATTYSFIPKDNATGEITISWTLTQKAIYVKSIEVTYEDTSAVPGAVVFDPAEGAVEQGTTVTMTASGASSISYKVDGGTPVSNEGNSCTVQITQGCTIEAWGTNDNGEGEHNVATYTIKKKTATLGFKEPELTVYLSSLVNKRDDEVARHELTYPAGFPVNKVVYSSSDEKVASFDDLNNLLYHEKGQTTITASFPGDDDYEAAEPATFTLNVELTKPQTESFTINFLKGSKTNTNGTSFKTSTTIADIVEETDRAVDYAGSSNSYYQSCNGLRIGTSSNFGTFTLNLNQEYSVKSIAAHVSNWSSDDTNINLFIEGKACDSKGGKVENTIKTGTYDEVHRFNYSPASKIQNILLASGTVNNIKSRFYIHSLDVEYEVEGAPLEAPVPFDEEGNYMVVGADGEFQNVLTDFIRFEHEKDVEIYYSYTNAGSAQPQAAPARVAAADAITVNGETYNKLATDVSEEESKVSGKFYPFGEQWENVNEGTLKVIAKKGETTSQPLTFNIAVPTGVEGVEVEAAGAAEYYTLQGVRVQNPEKGIYIRVINGKAVKVVL